MSQQAPEEAHCRICGSRELNIVNYIYDPSDKLSLQRIIIRGHSGDRLIRPCECRGEFAYSHQVCLSEWIETTKHEYCDICRFRYNVFFLDRTIFDWLSETQQVDRIKNVLFVSTLVYYISFLGILNHISVGTSGNLVSVLVFSSAWIWITFCTVALIVYSCWSWAEFKEWQLANRRVLVDENKNPQFEADPRGKDTLKSSGFKPG